MGAGVHVLSQNHLAGVGSYPFSSGGENPIFTETGAFSYAVLL
jgi:hypothetical protein